MGAKSSKAEGLSRSLSIRKSQRNSLQKVQRKLDKVSKDIHKFSGSVDDAKYADIKKAIAQIIDELEKISSTVKDKHKDLYQDILERCNHQLQRLDMKVTHASRPTSATSLPPQASSPIVSPIASPISFSSSSPLPHPPLSPPLSTDSPLSDRSGSVKLKVVTVTVENNDEKRQEKNQMKAIDESSDEEHDPQRDAVNTIDQMRRKIEVLDEKIHEYKTTNDQNLYEQIRTSLNQIIIKLDNMETYGNIQIKYERKLAMQRAEECMKYLNDNSKPKNRQTQVIVEMHQTTTAASADENVETREKSRSPVYTRPITLDLNANDQLKEELRQVIHKRIEEATEDDEADGVAKTPYTVQEPEENFDNTESEDDYDFVKVEGEENSKSAPVLVTSL